MRPAAKGNGEVLCTSAATGVGGSSSIGSKFRGALTLHAFTHSPGALSVQLIHILL